MKQSIQKENMGYPSLNKLHPNMKRMPLNKQTMNRNFPSQIRSNTGPVIKNKTNINRIF